jgi:hypothetical protein
MDDDNDSEYPIVNTEEIEELIEILDDNNDDSPKLITDIIFD